MEDPIEPAEYFSTFYSNQVKVSDVVVLDEGQSDAKVWSLTITDETRRAPEGQSLNGFRILKAKYHGSGTGGTEATYMEQLKRVNPKFLESFGVGNEAPRVNAGWIYLLTQKVSSMDGYQATSLQGLHDSSLEHIVRAVSRALLPFIEQSHSLNTDQTLKISESQKTSLDLIKGWIAKRLNKDNEGFQRILDVRRSFVSNTADSEITEIRLATEIFPDPFWLCLASDEFRDVKIINSYRGYLHGDLHPGNILCCGNQGLREQHKTFRLIDWEYFKESNLLFDHANLKVALFVQSKLAENLDFSINFQRSALWVLGVGRPEDTPEGEIRSTKNAISAVEKVVKSWEEEKKSEFGENIPPQALLADMAAGLRWAGYKDTTLEKKRLAYIFSLVAAKKFVLWFEKTGQTINTSKSIPKSRITRDVSPNVEGSGRFLSHQSLLNALLLANEMSWRELTDHFGEDGFQRICNGEKLEDIDQERLLKLVDIFHIFKNTESNEVSKYMSIDGIDESSIERRLDLIKTTDSRTNRYLRLLLKNKLRFHEAKWLDDVIDELKNIASNELLQNRHNINQISDRTWKLKEAYYQAGIQLSADDMADAAIAEFSDKRWLPIISGNPRTQVHSHLLVSNEKIGNIVRRRVLKSKSDSIAIAEGGVGGGHTAYFVLEALKNADRQHGGVRYVGIELIPTLAGKVNSQLTGIDKKSDPDNIFAELKPTNQSGEQGLILEPLLLSGDFVVNGRMEDLLDPISQELMVSGVEIDVCIISYAYHHVPNGKAIIQYLSNDAAGYSKCLDQEDIRCRDEIATSIADGCKALFHSLVNSVKLGDPEIYVTARSEILNKHKNGSHAQVSVFLSLFDPGTVTKEEVDLFAKTIVKRHWYPKQELERMLRNPQREVLLTAQSILKEDGLLIIADPDGTSDFNAKYAAEDPELTIANFLSADEVESSLDHLGFESTESYEIFPARNTDKDIIVRRDITRNPGLDEERPPLGYIVAAQRSKKRERELSGLAMSRGTGFRISIPDFKEKNVGRLGELLKKDCDKTKRIFDEILTPPDPYIKSSTLFRDLPELRFELLKAGWIENLQGSAIIARKRVHRLSNIRDHNSIPIIVATDFPSTASDIRANVRKVFSHCDEAEDMKAKLVECLDVFKDRPCRVLDCCAGAGTLGLFAASYHEKAEVVFVDKDARAVKQIEENLRLNNLMGSRVSVEQADLWPTKRMRHFDLILADPPFLLRPQAPGEENIDSGGRHGDSISGRILANARDYLSDNGRLIILAYTLLETGREKKLKINQFISNSGLDGGFEPVNGCVWRYRHSKIAENDSISGAPLWITAIRLGDTTRPEAINFDSAEKARVELAIHREWLDELYKQYSGFQFVIGDFRPKK